MPVLLTEKNTSIIAMYFSVKRNRVVSFTSSV